MLLSMLEYYILSEFKSVRVLRINRNRKGLSGCYDSFFVEERAFLGKQIRHSSLLELIFKKRNLSRSIIFVGLTLLTDSGYLVFL